MCVTVPKRDFNVFDNVNLLLFCFVFSVVFRLIEIDLGKQA